MKRLFITFLALMTAIATEGVAQPNERLLTMEEAVLGRGLAVENIQCTWRSNGASYTIIEGEELYDVNPETNERKLLTTLEKMNRIVGADLKRIPAHTLTGKGTLRFYAGRELVGFDTNVDTMIHRFPIPEGAQNLRYADEGRFLFTRGNNLYHTERDGSIYAITENADKNIVSGQSVSRNEFGIVGGMFPAPDKIQVAFFQKDESNVKSFPLLNINTRTGESVDIKYPMAGMASEKVRLGIYNYETRKTVWVEPTDFDEERYLTCISWGPDSKTVYIQVLDRAQKQMHLNAYSAEDGSFIKTILTEENEKYVEPQYDLHFIKGEPEKFIYTTSNRDGWRNLYLCSLADGSIERLTKVDADVELVAVHGRYLYYYTTEFSPVERHLVRLDRKTGKRLRLTTEPGVHLCTISPDGRYFFDSYSSLEVPRVVRIAQTDGKKSRELLRAEDPSKEINYGTIELGTVKSADGNYDNYYRLIKPHNFDPAKKYPVILYVYGGPHSQMVTNSFQAQLRRWEMYMAQRGYVVFVMDNRGTTNRGLAFEQAIHGQCGKCEMADQMAGLEWLLAHKWCDRERVGVHGWSYGGFMTISLMTNYPEVFKVGVAGGPVIDWKWYEVMYGERYMDHPEKNKEGYASTSLLPMAEKLEGKLLICQGAIDPTVVWQHSLSFVECCIKAGVQVDYFPYPTHEHNVMGKDRVHLMQKVTDYFEDYLR